MLFSIVALFLKKGDFGCQKRVTEVDFWKRAIKGLQFRFRNALKMQNKENTLNPEKRSITPFLTLF